MALSYVTYPGAGSQMNSNVVAILVHGGALSSSMYQTMAPHLAMRSLAIDLPGHGKSHSLGPFTFERSTQSLKSLIDQLRLEPEYKTTRFLLIGISLGGQVVLDFLIHHPTYAFSAIVSGATINPPDETARWEMPHMPTEQVWVDRMMADVGIVGMDAANGIQKESLAFNINGLAEVGNLPPILICVGEHDVAMAKRDFNKLVTSVKARSPMSEDRVIDSAWHNHSIDIPEQFAAIINEWTKKVLGNSDT